MAKVKTALAASLRLDLRALQRRVIKLDNGCWYLRTGGGYGPLAPGRVNARRLCYGLLPGRPPLGDRVVQATCGDPKCVNPHHLVRGSRRKGGDHTPHPKGRAQRRYPWGEWFAAGSFVLSSRDYNGGPATMAQQVRNNARLHKVRVSVHIDGTTLHVKVTEQLA